MIHLPRRSITRFFIPLLDVMVLLFSLFLLMPLVRQAVEEESQEQLQSVEEPPADQEILEQQLRQALRQLAQVRQRQRLEAELERLRSEVQQLKNNKKHLLQQMLVVRVLEVDPKNGQLVVYEAGMPPRRRILADRQAAQQFIAAQQQAAAPQEVYFVFLLPRTDSPYPEGRQLEQYLDWFREVPHGIDRPGAPAP
jgi:cell shape-determining protein MreC